MALKTTGADPGAAVDPKDMVEVDGVLYRPCDVPEGAARAETKMRTPAPAARRTK